MSALFQALDWKSTPLGPTDTWPPGLKTALSIAPGARFPMAIYRGAEKFLLYNDAWKPIAGNKHPWALGRPAREVWPEIWEAIAPLLNSVRETGEATWRSDELLSMQRFGYTEECYFDYTFNPIRGEDGAIEGILNVVQETTERVLSERRTRLVQELTVRTLAAKTEDQACARAIEALATDPADVPFALL